MRALLLISLAFATAAGAEQVQKFSATVSPGGHHEECVKMDKGEIRNYEWKASAAADFNIHYHEGSEVFYPVKKDGATKDKGIFKAKIAQDYCWMWTAKAPATVTGQIAK
jgi:hypothetical protein